MPQIMDLLVRKFQCIHPLAPAELDALIVACARVIAVPSDHELSREGDRPDCCNLLLEGMVYRNKVTADGKRQIHSFHVPGDFFDTQSYLLGRMDHNVATLGPCRIGVFPHSSILSLIDHHPRVGRALWKDCLIDAAIFREWLVNIGRRSAYKRIAHLMCEIITKVDVVSLIADDKTISWPITQSHIADALGLSLVHVNRTIMELRAAKLIVLKSARLTVLDWEGLQEAGEFEAGYLHLNEPHPLHAA